MQQFEISGIELQIEGDGRGSDAGAVLYLHPEHHFSNNQRFIAQLQQLGAVYCPRHPGFDGSTDGVSLRTVDELAYLYLDLLEYLNLSDVLLVGASFGGWIGLEMAVRDCSRLRAMALIAPLGCRFGARDEREFADLSALSERAVQEHLYLDPDVFAPDHAHIDTDELVLIAKEREALAHYAWSPYLHNPILARWLHRIACPIHIVQGVADRYVVRSNGAELAQRLPNARMTVIDGAGHYPQVERCSETFELLANWQGANFA